MVKFEGVYCWYQCPIHRTDYEILKKPPGYKEMYMRSFITAFLNNSQKLETA